MNEITWEEFKKLVKTWKDHKELMFRGHASHTWQLKPTLGRINEKEFCYARSYHLRLKHVIETYRLDFPTFPERDPLLISLMIANDEHKRDFENYFNMLIELRHRGIPSPILDWTKNPLVAAYFATKDNKSHAPIIWVAKYEQQVKSIFDLNTFKFDSVNLNSNSIFRHTKQQAVYTLVVDHDHKDFVGSDSMKKGPKFYIEDHESNLPSHQIEKYMIKDFIDQSDGIVSELKIQGYSDLELFGSDNEIDQLRCDDTFMDFFKMEPSE